MMRMGWSRGIKGEKTELIGWGVEVGVGGVAGAKLRCIFSQKGAIMSRI